MRHAIADGPAGRIAVLVDADNVQGEEICSAMREMSAHGKILVRRAFGRLTSIRAHEEILTGLCFSAEVALPLAHAGKNAADLLLAQYATRLAERQAVDMVAIVSSDGDFAAIARGLAESGVQVIGFGRQDASRALRDACTLFRVVTAGPPIEPLKQRTALDRDLANLKRVIDHALGTDGRASASLLGTMMNRAFGGDYKRHFTVSTLSELIARVEGYSMESEGTVKSVVRTVNG